MTHKRRLTTDLTTTMPTQTTKTKTTLSKPTAKNIFSYRPYWAARFGVAPFLPTSREEMDQLGWDQCDVIVVTGDAYIDHPSFGMAIIGRLLEAQGFRVGIIAQPDWQSTEDFMRLGEPALYMGITAGNMDSMVNRYTSDKRLRHNDAYTPHDEGGKRPDRATIVYAQRVREAFKQVPIVIGGIEASLRRIAHYDYWSEQVRRSILLDSRADILLYGNAERALVELTHRLARGEKVADLRDIRGTAINLAYQSNTAWVEIDSTSIDEPSADKILPPVNPYQTMTSTTDNASSPTCQTPNKTVETPLQPSKKSEDLNQVIRLPSYHQVKNDPVLYAHTSRLLHLETNPYNARPLVQQHHDRDIWINPPPIPLTTPEMDRLFALPFARNPHPVYNNAKVPAWEMIKFSVNIMRGCFGGCTFCSITEHEGRVIQSRSEASILQEIEDIRDKTLGFTGIISDLGGPTANMYRLQCLDEVAEKHCRRLSCVYPTICRNLNTDHSHLTQLYRKARSLKGIKKILIASGLRYDLAVKDHEYIKELVTHHVGGYLKIAPEHTESAPLSKMMKPGIGSYDEFKRLFEKFSREAGKEQYLIPYFIAAHPGTTDEDMLNLALWLKKNGFRADQVQAYLPTPMSLAGAMYHSGRNPLKAIRRESEQVFSAKGLARRRLHKAFLRYHDPNNWPLLRDALRRMGRGDLIGSRKHQLIPAYQPLQASGGGEGLRKGKKHGQQTFVTKGIYGQKPKPRSYPKPKTQQD